MQIISTSEVCYALVRMHRAITSSAIGHFRKRALMLHAVAS